MQQHSVTTKNVFQALLRPCGNIHHRTQCCLRDLRSNTSNSPDSPDIWIILGIGDGKSLNSLQLYNDKYCSSTIGLFAHVVFYKLENLPPLLVLLLYPFYHVTDKSTYLWHFATNFWQYHHFPVLSCPVPSFRNVLQALANQFDD